MDAPSEAKARRKISIACARCKTRKNRCDGRWPRCGNCTSHDSECVYAKAPRRRGKGKKKATETVPNGDDRAAPTEPGQTRSREPMPPFPIMADFLLPGAYAPQLAALQDAAEAAAAAETDQPWRRCLTPLLPRHIAVRLIAHAVLPTVGGHALVDLDRFPSQLTAQYAASTTDPGDTPARWALVNAVLALAMRSKMAPGADAALAGIHRRAFANAMAVLPALLLGTPTLEAVQALVAMAVFARGDKADEAVEVDDAAVLVDNATRLLEVLMRRLLPLDAAWLDAVEMAAVLAVLQRNVNV